jgi:hypothetical protein
VFACTALGAGWRTRCANTPRPNPHHNPRRHDDQDN